jgi:hypothetical protein
MSALCCLDSVVTTALSVAVVVAVVLIATVAVVIVATVAVSSSVVVCLCFLHCLVCPVLSRQCGDDDESGVTTTTVW